MIVVSAYSRHTPYEQEAEILRKSLLRCGMRHEIVPFEDQGDWYANTSMKPRLIREMRDKHRGPMVWVDADAFVHEDCAAYFDDLGRKGFDFGAHWFAGPAKGHNQSDVCACLRGGKCSREHRFLSGTLFFGDTTAARKLIRAWVDLNHLFRERNIVMGGGQKNLWYLLTCVEKLKQAKLPGRFTYVFDKPWGYPVTEPRIIEHTIASRDNRKPGQKNKARHVRKAELREKLAA